VDPEPRSTEIILLEESLSVRILSGMGRRLLPVAAVVSAVVVCANPSLAQEVSAETAEKSSTGREHVVRKGDTLWDLAKLYLSNPFLWGLIYEANRGVVANPHLIYPENRLLIPDGSLLAVPGQAPGGAPFGGAAGWTAAGDGSDRTLFYRSGEAGLSGDAIPTLLAGDGEEVAVVQPGEYLAAPWLAERSALPVVGTLVRVRGDGDGRGSVSQSVHPWDRVYVRHRGKNVPEVGDRLLLVREGRRLRGWGRVVAPGAIGVVEEVSEDVALVAIHQQFGRVEPGDLALPLAALPVVKGRPQPVTDGAQATLLGFVEEQPVYDQSDQGFVDLGERDGVAVGDEFEIYRPERSTGGWSAIDLPEEPIGRLRVIRVAERTATVRLIRLDQGSLKAGMPVRLVGKMP
jgi:hypothetical protein